ncbi:MAG: DUF488 family protein [Nitrososphaerales archaeon]
MSGDAGRKRKAAKQTVVYAIGHSTRTIEDFIEILRAYEINAVMDIRTIPRSRHNPQFNKDTLPLYLKEAKIRYLHMPKLGGLRHALPDSINNAWRNASFRGFADYMQTDEFRSALNSLIELSKRSKIVMMCAESLPWRCHRSLIADALLVRKVKTIDIFSPKVSKIHILTPWAKVRGTRITYPLIESSLKSR